MPTSNMRRRFLLAGITASIIAHPLAGMAQDGSVRLQRWQYDRLNDIGNNISRRLWGLDIENGLMDDHYRIRIPSRLLFVKPASDRLQKDGIHLLTTLAEGLKANRKWRMEIVAHCSPQSSEYKSTIATRRQAEMVLATLQSRRVDGHLMKATGLGDLFPIVNAGHGNDRVEFLISLAPR